MIRRAVLDSLRRSTTKALVSRFVENFSTVILKERSISLKPPGTSRLINTNIIFAATTKRKYQFFQNVEVASTGVAIIRFDNPDKKVNTISFALKDEAEILWNNEIHSNPLVKAVVFTSGKHDSFIAGADIFDIQRLNNKEEIIPLIKSATVFFKKMKRKGVPLVCAINGPALGGGLEWCLWCDYRICTDNPKTKLGLPEVKLGLLPGFGGTQNLHKLVGLQKAMDMMLTGKDIRPDQAKKMGLVDIVVSSHSLEKTAIQAAQDLADGSLKKSTRKRKTSFMDKFIEDTSIGNYFMWRKINSMIQKQTNNNYPSPLAIIECVQFGLKNPKGDAKFKFERESFAKLAETNESESLIGIFNGMTQMKKHAYGDVMHSIEKVAVVGAGLMGAGIAQISSEKGYDVLLKDKDNLAIGRGVKYIDKNWEKKFNRKRMSKYQRNLNESKLVTLTETMEWENHFAKADMVIEAVFENIDLKRHVLAECEKTTRDHCIFASNTSAIPIAEIAKNAKRPENVIDGKRNALLFSSPKYAFVRNYSSRWHLQFSDSSCV